MSEDLLRDFCARLNSRFAEDSLESRAQSWRHSPERFAREVLRSRWWEMQRRVATEVSQSRRTAVKSANGVGKTYLAADLALWFLYSYRPSVVLTTAPTERQMRHLLWEEIRRRWHGASETLPGRLLQTRLALADGWYAMGLSADEGVRFQGYHAENLLVLFDEASGIADEIWDAAEGVAVGRNNRILAIGNPLCASGRFYRIFREDSGWRKLTISAFDHPNLTGRGEPIPGAVTPESVEERIAEWCEPAEAEAGAETFCWNGHIYRPNNLFRARVLGEFPDSEEDSLIPLRWVEAAMGRPLSAAAGTRRAAADVARFGGDWTVIGLRVGDVLVRLDAVRGADLMEVAGRIARLAYDEKPVSIAVDGIGLGAGVVDRLWEMGVECVVSVNVALPAYDPERFANRRAELYWGLRERFRTGEIALPRDELLCEQLTSLRYKHTSRGQIAIESKEEMKRRGQSSPDRADMLALLFEGSPGEDVSDRPRPASPSPAQLLREEMERDFGP